GTMLGSILDLALVTQEVTPEDLQAVRAPLEKQAARLAAAHLDRARDDELRHLCELMRNPRSAQDGVQADHRFHSLIFSSSGNNALAFFGYVLSAALERTLVDWRLAIASDRRAQLEIARSHERILAALEERDPDSAEDAVEAHFRTYERVVRRIARRKAALS